MSEKIDIEQVDGIGALESLTTTDKTSLVNAINEVNGNSRTYYTYYPSGLTSTGLLFKDENGDDFSTTSSTGRIYDIRLSTRATAAHTGARYVLYHDGSAWNVEEITPYSTSGFQARLRINSSGLPEIFNNQTNTAYGAHANVTVYHTDPGKGAEWKRFISIDYNLLFNTPNFTTYFKAVSGLQNGTDLNAVLEMGSYIASNAVASSILNKPVATSLGFSLAVYRHGNYLVQEIYYNELPNKRYYRISALIGVSWHPWRQVITDENLDSQATSLGFIKSSSLSGYLPLSGGTMTGRIIGRQLGGSWITGVSGTSSGIYYNAPSTNSTYSSWIGQRTFEGGSFSIGSLGSNFYISYATPENITANINETNQILALNKTGNAIFTGELSVTNTLSVWTATQGVNRDAILELKRGNDRSIEYGATAWADARIIFNNDFTIERKVSGNTSNLLKISSTGLITSINDGNSSQWKQAYDLVSLGGVSRTSVLLNSSNDLDLVVDPGYYHHIGGSAPLNKPVSGAIAGYLEVVSDGAGLAGQFVRQTWRARDSSGEYQRTRSSGGDWSAWVQYYNTGNFNPAQYVLQSALNTQLANYVPINGVTTINNTKTFTSSPIVPNATLNSHAVNLGQLNTILGDYATETWVNSQGFSTQTLTAGSNISIVGNVISATDTNTTYSAGTGLTLNGTEFSQEITYAGAGSFVTQVVQNENGLTVILGEPTNTITRVRANSNGTYSTGNITLLPGNNVSLTQSGGNITINAVNTNTTYTGSTSIILASGSFQRAALTGDVTASQNSNTTTIANNAVTNTKMAQMNANSIKGRAGSIGNPQDLTPAQVRTIINVQEGANRTRIGINGGNYTEVGDINLIAGSNVSLSKSGENITINSASQSIDLTVKVYMPGEVANNDTVSCNASKTIIYLHPMFTGPLNIAIDPELQDGAELIVIHTLSTGTVTSFTINGNLITHLGQFVSTYVVSQRRTYRFVYVKDLERFALVVVGQV